MFSCRLNYFFIPITVIVWIFYFYNYIHLEFMMQQRGRLKDKVHSLSSQGGSFNDTDNPLTTQGSRHVFVMASQGSRNQIAIEHIVANNDSVIKTNPLLVATGNNMFIIKNENICKASENISILVLIHSSTVHFKNREAIRKTWGSVRKFQSFCVRVIFVLGKPDNKSIQTPIEQENDLFRDIVQGNFLDTYYNLTNKAVLGLRWITEYCHNVKFVIKLDDDVHINPFQIYDALNRKMSNLSRTIVCKVRPKGTSMIHRKGKWAVYEAEFANMYKWPVTYCPGHVVIYTNDIIPDLYSAAKFTPFLRLDDVYVTGILAHKVGHISHRNMKILSDHVTLLESTNSTNKMYELWKTANRGRVTQ